MIWDDIVPIMTSLWWPSKAECLYNAVQYNMTLHTSLQWLCQNVYQSFNPQDTPYLALADELRDVFGKDLGEN